MLETMQEKIDFTRIASAIEYIDEHYAEQPSLEVVAKQIHLSEYHLQRLFTEWAGVSPKKFLQYITVAHARSILQRQNTLFSTAFASGLSGTGRLHDLFVTIEGMTPAEYRDGGASLEISYDFYPSPFGDLIIANTRKGICLLAFHDSGEDAISQLKERFPQAMLTQCPHQMHDAALELISLKSDIGAKVPLHLRATNFQLKVWEALLKIPSGDLTTYGQIASEIGDRKASRAVGTAIGSNPIAFIIPCHRVIQSTGHFGNYMWGRGRKQAIIGFEQCHLAS